MTGRAAKEAKRRRRARARKAEVAAAAPVVEVRLYGWGEGEPPLDHWCPDKENHKVCPKTGGDHGWYKPHPRPRDHKYECEDCGHYDLDDYM